MTARKGRPGAATRRRRRRRETHQPFRTQQIAHRAGRRPHRLGALAHQHCAQLARTPMGTLPAQSNNRFGQLRRHRPTMTVRRTRALHQALRAVLAIATEPFVARLAADAVVLAKRCHRQLTTQTVRNKNQLLVHTTGLLPRHRPPPGPAITCHPSIRSILLPIYPVCTKSPPPPNPLPPEGRRGDEGGAGGTLPLRPLGGERAGVRWGCFFISLKRRALVFLISLNGGRELRSLAYAPFGARRSRAVRSASQPGT